MPIVAQTTHDSFAPPPPPFWHVPPPPPPVRLGGWDNPLGGAKGPQHARILPFTMTATPFTLIPFLLTRWRLELQFVVCRQCLPPVDAVCPKYTPSSIVDNAACASCTQRQGSSLQMRLAFYAA